MLSQGGGIKIGVTDGSGKRGTPDDGREKTFSPWGDRWGRGGGGVIDFPFLGCGLKEKGEAKPKRKKS